MTETRPPASLPADLPGRFRDEFPITATRAYLFSGGLAPAALRVSRAVEEWVHRWQSDPGCLWDEVFTEWEAVRERLGRLFGCPAGCIAIVDGTSRASNLAVQLLNVEPGANVVVDATTYPSSLYPWLLPAQAGVEVRRAASGRAGLAASVDELAALVDDRTVAVSVSHIEANTGVRHDLRPIADLAHEHGAALIVDLAQSAGVLPIDIARDGIDLASGTAMKWLLGPPGIGYLYVSEALLARTGAPMAGYVGTELDEAVRGRPPLATGEMTLRFAPDARRHELGLASLLGMPGLRAGLDLILEAGTGAISAHVERLVSRCFDGLETLGVAATTPRAPDCRGGLLSVPVARPMELHAFLRERGVDVWGYDKGGLIRADPHLFNNDHDIDRLLDGIDAFMRERGRVASQPA